MRLFCFNGTAHFLSVLRYVIHLSLKMCEYSENNPLLRITQPNPIWESQKFEIVPKIFIYMTNFQALFVPERYPIWIFQDWDTIRSKIRFSMTTLFVAKTCSSICYYSSSVYLVALVARFLNSPLLIKWKSLDSLFFSLLYLRFTCLNSVFCAIAPVIPNHANKPEKWGNYNQ